MNKSTNVNLRTGSKMPIMGLGTWQLTNRTADTIQKALQLGYRMIDTSGDYGTQPEIGKGIKKSRVARDSVYIVTKVEEDEDAYESTKKNLDELQLGYADLVLIHRPPTSGVGPDLWEGLIKAKEEDIVKDIGVSNYNQEQIQRLIDETGEPPAVNQIEWSPFGHSMEMLGFCQENNIVLQAYSPLTRAKRLDENALEEIAETYGKTPSQLVICWNLQLGTVPIVKANQPQHLQEDIEVFDFEISPDDMEKLNELNEEYSALGELVYT